LCNTDLVDLLVDCCVFIREGGEVSIEEPVESIPFILVKQIVKRSGYPVVRVSDESIVEAFYEYVSENVLKHVSAIEREIALKINAAICIYVPTHTKPLSSIDPQRLKLRVQ